MKSPHSRLGGFGAIAFLGCFAGIAVYVQSRQTRVPELNFTEVALADGADAAKLEGHEEAAPGQPTAAPALANDAVNWRQKLDLKALVLTPFASAVTKAIRPDGGTKPVISAETGLEVDSTESQESSVTIKDSFDPWQLPQGATPRLEEGLYVQTLSDETRVLYTLDPVLQQAAETIFRNREIPYAAAVMLDLQDNSVLLAASHSSMDPQADKLEILATPWAPAASIFKIVTAEALLHTSKVYPNSKACFHGGLSGITDDLLRDNSKLDTRCENLSDAVAHSHNLVVAKLAQKYLSQEELQASTRRFQFNLPIDFEFPIDPSRAQIPADARARAKVAAGFWQVEMSPIHAALIASIFARDGYYQSPHIVSHVLQSDGVEEIIRPPSGRSVVASADARRVAKMMLLTTTKGTAQSSFFDTKTGMSYTGQMTVAGKTGNLNGKRAPALNYNWFVGFAPAENPEVAFAVILANPAKWQIKAHYAARRLVQVYATRRDAIAANRHARLSNKGLVAGKHSARTADRAKPTNTTGKASIDDLRVAQEESPSAEAPTRAASTNRGSEARSGRGSAQEGRTSRSSGKLPPVPGALRRSQKQDN